MPRQVIIPVNGHRPAGSLLVRPFRPRSNFSLPNQIQWFGRHLKGETRVYQQRTCRLAHSGVL